MKERLIGKVRVGEIGLGCMGMTWAYGKSETGADEHIAVIRRALDLGATLIDTADIYGPFTNEELVGRALAGRRDRAVLATKCGLVRGGAGLYDMQRNGRPEHIRRAIDASLSRLHVDVIDLYQLHRVDPEVPIEESWGAMASLVDAGKVRAIGLSEVTVEQIERARKVAPVASVQSELSLWTRDHAAVVAHCAAQGIAFLAYSPLGRGFLTGQYTTPAAFDPNDWRQRNPRFSDAAMRENAALVAAVERVARRKGATPGQIALAWTLAQADVVIPIPGTRRLARLEENVAAARVELSREDLAELDALPVASGARY